MNRDSGKRKVLVYGLVGLGIFLAFISTPYGEERKKRERSTKALPHLEIRKALMEDRKSWFIPLSFSSQFSPDKTRIHEQHSIDKGFYDLSVRGDIPIAYSKAKGDEFELTAESPLSIRVQGPPDHLELLACKKLFLDSLEKPNAVIGLEAGPVSKKRVFYTLKELVRRELRKWRQAQRKIIRKVFHKKKWYLMRRGEWNKNNKRYHRRKFLKAIFGLRKAGKRMRRSLFQKYIGVQEIHHHIRLHVERDSVTCKELNL